MTADQYLYRILAREAVDTGPLAPVRGVIGQMTMLLQEWGAGYVQSINPSGSFAKGTANRSGTDIDLFISIAQGTPGTLKEAYDNLFAYMGAKGFTPKRRNVSISVRASTAGGGMYDVDLVPGRRQDTMTQDHSLWRNRADTWTKTNVQRHIAHVLAGNRLQESRILKLWRIQQGLDYPSFYVELSVIAALTGRLGTLSNQVWRVLEYLATDFPNARVIDPANTNNIISDDLIQLEKNKVRDAAKRALGAKTWEEIIK